MFTKISWEDYFIVIGLMLAGYYVFIGLRYYSGDLKDLLSGKRKLRFGERQTQSLQSETAASKDENYPNSNANVEPESESDRTDVDNLVERLQKVIADASGKKLIPREFIQYLEFVLREYPNIKNSPYRSSINELIVSECEKYGAVALSEEEVELMWKDT